MNNVVNTEEHSFQRYLQERMKALELKTYHLSQLTGLSSTHINKLINKISANNKTTTLKAIAQPNRKTIIFILLALGVSLTEINFYLEAFGYSQIREDRIHLDINIFEEYVIRLAKNFGGFYPLKTGLHIDLAMYAIETVQGDFKSYSHVLPMMFCHKLENELLEFIKQVSTETDDILSQFKKKVRLSDYQRYYFIDESFSNPLELAINQKRFEIQLENQVNFNQITMIGTKQLNTYLSPIVKLINLFSSTEQQQLAIQIIKRHLEAIQKSDFLLTRSSSHFKFTIKTFTSSEAKNDVNDQILFYIANTENQINQKHSTLDDYAKNHDLAGYIVNDPRLIKNFEEEWKRLSQSVLSAEEKTKLNGLINKLNTVSDLEHLLSFL